MIELFGEKEIIKAMDETQRQKCDEKREGQLEKEPSVKNKENKKPAANEETEEVQILLPPVEDIKITLNTETRSFSMINPIDLTPSVLNSVELKDKDYRPNEEIKSLIELSHFKNENEKLIVEKKNKELLTQYGESFSIFSELKNSSFFGKLMILFISLPVALLVTPPVLLREKLNDWEQDIAQNKKRSIISNIRLFFVKTALLLIDIINFMFVIIVILLVLAIVGVLFAIVFVGIPTLIARLIGGEWGAIIPMW